MINTWLLIEPARGGTPNQLGSVQNDQMQGHWHEMVYRQDSISSGYRSDIFGTDGFTASGYSNTGGTDEWMQRLGNRKNDALCAITPITDNTNGTPRVGAETRPNGLLHEFHFFPFKKLKTFTFFLKK